MKTSWKDCGKRRNCPFWAISFLSQSMFSTPKSPIVGIQKNRLSEMILLSSHNRFVWVIREILWRKEQFTPLNHFPHIDAFPRLCSRWLYENLATKERIAQNNQYEQFLLLLPRFRLYLIIVLSSKGNFFFCSCMF